MKGRCADENHARTRKTRFLYDWLSSYEADYSISGRSWRVAKGNSLPAGNVYSLRFHDAGRRAPSQGRPDPALMEAEEKDILVYP